jgi:phosphoserine phosphatase
MDGTLLNGRVIYFVGQKVGFKSEIDRITKLTKIPYVRSQRIAELLKGLTVLEFSELVKQIPLMKGAIETVKQLKEKDYKVGIISDSYTIATNVLAKKLGMDFHVANILEAEKGVLTGFLKMPLGWEKIGCSCRQSVCKRYHLIRLAKEYNVNLPNTIAVGDSSADLGMLDTAGTGILFNPAEEKALHKVNFTICKKDLQLILDYLKK